MLRLMTRIGFYILRAAQPHDFVCRLCHQLYRRGQSVYVHVDSDEVLRTVDRLLWTQQPGSFVPHDRLPADDVALTPILLGQGDPPEHCTDVLINLATDVPLFFSRFERVAEVIPSEDTLRTAGRQRFQFYRDRGYPLDTHQDVDG